MTTVRPVEWMDGYIRLLDQTMLPAEVRYVELRAPEDVRDAIRGLVVRGAPAIGITAAYGYCLGAHRSAAKDVPALRQELAAVKERLLTARPTAVNLAWALDRMECTVEGGEFADIDAARRALVAEASRIQADDERACRSMGGHVLGLLEDGMGVLTHCNTGALATSRYGTALAGLYLAHERGWRIRVFADETRPVLQGSRLTAWELQQAGIDVTVICDNMAATVMAQGLVHAVVVGADRIARNGDTANKIGTLALAVLAHHFGIPFYVVAPRSSFDPAIDSGGGIPIEQRPIDEVINGFGRRTAPLGVQVYNPAFDVTPHELISAIITEDGIFRPPFSEGAASFVS